MRLNDSITKSNFKFNEMKKLENYFAILFVATLSFTLLSCSESNDVIEETKETPQLSTKSCLMVNSLNLLLNAEESINESGGTELNSEDLEYCTLINKLNYNDEAVSIEEVCNKNKRYKTVIFDNMLTENYRKQLIETTLEKISVTKGTDIKSIIENFKVKMQNLYDTNPEHKSTDITKYGFTYQIVLYVDLDVYIYGCSEEETLLEAAEDNGIDVLWYSSRCGADSTSLAILWSGTVVMPDQTFLDDEHIANLWILVDAAYPRSDCRLSGNQEDNYI